MQSSSPTSLDKLLNPLHDFAQLEAAGGLVLMAATVVALLAANSPLAPTYFALLDVPAEIRIGAFVLAKPLLLWINDGLMAVFFFLVGMELKREVVAGHLSTLSRASLPAFAALGGMLVPAAIYLYFNHGVPDATRGWAIPTATDIAFALGVLSLLGRRIPTALKSFLLSVAVFDDLGAIVVIALFYTAGLSTLSLVAAGVLILVLACLNRLGVVKPAPYVLVGILLWVAVLKSGVHATISGVVLAMFIPLRPPQPTSTSPDPESPLCRLENMLHPWVAFGVLPVFAFANAGVPVLGLSFGDLMHPVPIGVIAGLVLGKPIGVMALCWLSTRLGLAALPEGVGWGKLLGAAILCGIGFTMSLFIASLAFDQGGADPGRERLGILIGSFVSGLIGYIVLRATSSAPIEAESTLPR